MKRLNEEKEKKLKWYFIDKYLIIQTAEFNIVVRKFDRGRENIEKSLLLNQVLNKQI